MKSLRLMLVAFVPIFAGCGTTAADLAVTACQTEVATKVTGKSYELDLADMKAKYVATETRIGEISSRVTFDPGLPSETSQVFTCRVQFDPDNAGAPPAVIGLQFVW